MKEPVFFVPNTSVIVDLAVLRGDVLVSHFNHETIEQVALRYPGVIICEMEEAIAAHEQATKTPPVEITEERFVEMLNCLPPMDWVSRGNTQSFKMSEFTSGSITSIYVRNGERYFHLSDNFTVKHEEIIAKVELAFPTLH